MTQPKNPPVTPKSSGLQRIAAEGAAIRAAGPVVPGAPKEIVINGKQTGRYLTGGNLVGQMPRQPLDGYGSQEQLPQNELPNYEKLSGFERWTMNAMAGIPKPIAEALETFNNSWAGKALAWLDLPAEALERGAGFVTQAAEAYGNPEKWEDFTKNLTAAWYAGSTAADYGNIPQVSFENGQFKFNYTDEMPGIEGTVRVRKAVAANVAAGMTYDQALEEAKNRELENLGALAIRAQMQDMFMHIAGDPLNVVLPILKPVERLQAFRKLTLSRRIDTTIKIAAEVAGHEATVAKLTDALQAAQKLGEPGAILKATDDLARAQDLLTGTQKTLELAEVSKLSRAEQFVLRITGGLDEVADTSKATPLQKFVNKINPFALTPEAKAHEFVDIILENINTRLIPNIVKNGDFDINALARAIDRAAAGASSPEFGHIIATIEGQHVKGIMKQVSADVRAIAASFNATGEFERPLIDLMSLTLGVSPKKIMLRMEAGEAAEVFAQFMRKMQDGSQASAVTGKSLQTLLAKAGLVPEQFTADYLKTALSVFTGKYKDLYDSGAVVAEIMGKMADAAAQQSILRFGITERGFISKLAAATKQAETLAFMRLNPTYPVRNFLNNMVTMYARGALGFMSPGQIDNIWKLRGFKPGRLTEGVGMAGDLEHTFEATTILGKAKTIGNEVLAKASRGEGGWLDKLSDGIRDLPKKVGLKADFGTISAKIESAASEQAMATFYLRGERMFNKFGGSGALKTIGDFDPALAKGLGNAVTKEIHNFVRDAKLSPALLDDFVKGDKALNISGSKLRDLVEAKVGRPMGSVLTDEFLESIEPDILRAVELGDDLEIGKVFQGIGKKLDDHIGSLNDEAVKNIALEVGNRVEAEGPGAFARIWGDAVDEWYGGIGRHDIDTAKLADQIRGLGDPKVADAMWRRMQLQGENFFGRQWKRLEGRMEGLAKGAEKAGLNIQASEVSSSFSKWRDGWKLFFDERKTLYNDYFSAKLEGKTPALSFEDITAKLDKSYAKNVANEAAMTANIDKLVANALPDEIKPVYLTWRKNVANIRQADKDEVIKFRDYIRGIPPEAIGPAYDTHWKLRLKANTALWKEERRGIAAITGNPKAAEAYAQGAQAEQKIIEAETLAKAAQDAAKAVQPPPTTKGFIPDYDAVAKPEVHIGTGLDELTYTKGQDILEALQDEAMKMAKEPRLKWSNLTPDQQKGIERYLDNVKGQMADARYAATRFAEFGRDSALLNYNRRFNYNTWLGTVMPYEFWGTQSMVKWALHSVDRPAMLTTYLRMKKFLETAYRPENGLPSRLRGTLRIPIPFMPDWMGGEGFIDPLRMLLPFDSWAQPFEAAQQQALGDEGFAKRKLEEMFNDGLITQGEYEQALEEQVGPTWERALAMAQKDDTEERLNGWDFATMLTSPHAPLQWAYNAMKGEETPAVLPLTNTIGNVLGAFGLDPAGPLNPEAAIRKALGFHPFNKWDDYKTERMLVNMVAMGEISAQEAKIAMIEHKGAAWEEAYRMTWAEKSLGPVGFVLKLAGVPLGAYPEGEQDTRENLDKARAEYEAAWDKYEKTGDYKAAFDGFTEKYPFFEARLALFDKPEERLTKFLKQSLWSKWNEFDKIEKDAVLEQMPDFERDFVNKNSRLESVPAEKMAVWLKLLGGDVVGSLDVPDSAPLKIPPREIAQLAQTFYDGRDRMFPNWFETQEGYYALPEKSQERKQYLKEHPILKTYWAWRNDFLQRNSQIVPYVTDTAPKWFKPEMANQKGFDLTWDEWRANLGWTLSNLVLDYANGEDLPPVAESQLAKVAAEYGWQGSIEDFTQMIVESER